MVANDIDNDQFIVLRDPDGSGWQNKVTHIHPSLESARIEAERLARQHGKRFLVFQVVGAAQPAPVPVEWARATDPLPF